MWPPTRSVWGHFHILGQRSSLRKFLHLRRCWLCIHTIQIYSAGRSQYYCKISKWHSPLIATSSTCRVIQTDDPFVYILDRNSICTHWVLNFESPGLSGSYTANIGNTTLVIIELGRLFGVQFLGTKDSSQKGISVLQYHSKTLALHKMPQSSFSMVRNYPFKRTQSPKNDILSRMWGFQVLAALNGDTSIILNRFKQDMQEYSTIVEGIRLWLGFGHRRRAMPDLLTLLSRLGSLCLQVWSFLT